jgi:hypothetical protein
MTNSKRSDAARPCIHRAAALPDKGPSLISLDAASIILTEKAAHLLSPIPTTCRIPMQDPLDGEAFNTCMWLVEYQALPSVSVDDTLAPARLAVTVRGLLSAANTLDRAFQPQSDVDALDTGHTSSLKR